MIIMREIFKEIVLKIDGKDMKFRMKKTGRFFRGEGTEDDFGFRGRDTAGDDLQPAGMGDGKPDEGLPEALRGDAAGGMDTGLCGWMLGDAGDGD